MVGCGTERYGTERYIDINFELSVRCGHKFRRWLLYFIYSYRCLSLFDCAFSGCPQKISRVDTFRRRSPNGDAEGNFSNCRARMKTGTGRDCFRGRVSGIAGDEGLMFSCFQCAVDSVVFAFRQQSGDCSSIIGL